MLSQITEEVRCNSIEELIDAIERPPVFAADDNGSRIIQGHQQRYDSQLKGHYFLRGQSYVFRGVKSSEFSLMPSLFRNIGDDNFERRIAQLVGLNRYNGGFELPHFSSFNGNMSEEAYKVRISLIMEFYSLCAFYKNANLNGLRVPPIRAFDEVHSTSEFNIYGGEGEIVRKYLGSRDKYGQCENCPFTEYEALGALAQHYGIATRLLDWSYDPMAALYFAVIEAANTIIENNFGSEDTCAVWVMDVGNLAPYTQNKLRVVTPPYFDNPNLSAQKGVLAHWNAANLTEYMLPLDEQIAAYYSSRMDCKQLLSRKLFYKYTLPYSEIKHALHYLIIKGYTAARLFPGYQGVVKSFDEYRLFQLLCEPELVKKHLDSFNEGINNAANTIHIDLRGVGTWSAEDDKEEDI